MVVLYAEGHAGVGVAPWTLKAQQTNSNINNVAELIRLCWCEGVVA